MFKLSSVFFQLGRYFFAPWLTQIVYLHAICRRHAKVHFLLEFVFIDIMIHIDEVALLDSQSQWFVSLVIFQFIQIFYDHNNNSNNNNNRTKKIWKAKWGKNAGFIETDDRWCFCDDVNFNCCRDILEYYTHICMYIGRVLMSVWL